MVVESVYGHASVSILEDEQRGGIQGAHFLVDVTAAALYYGRHQLQRRLLISVQTWQVGTLFPSARCWIRIPHLVQFSSVTVAQRKPCQVPHVPSAPCTYAFHTFPGTLHRLIPGSITPSHPQIVPSHAFVFCVSAGSSLIFHAVVAPLLWTYRERSGVGAGNDGFPHSRGKENFTDSTPAITPTLVSAIQSLWVLALGRLSVVLRPSSVSSRPFFFLS